MKAFFFRAAAVAAAALSCGCPVYPDEGDSRVCTPDGCFDCPDHKYSGACGPAHCASSSDCSTGYICGRGNVCVLGGSRDAGALGSSCTTPAECPSGWTCGWDYACHAGDCSGEVGCPSGYQCTVSKGRAQCSSGPGGDSDAGSRESGTDGSPPDAQPVVQPNEAGFLDTGAGAIVQPNEAGFLDTGAGAIVQPNEAGPPDTGADAFSTSPNGAACNADWQCAGAGAKCIEGQCTAADHLCADAIQCPAGSPVCVDGRCAPRCSAGDPCPTGFACDFNRGACSVNPGSCTCDAQCLGGTKCVESRCVAPCASGDADTACPIGQVCINSGCMPHERVLPSCKN
jgi:hypothetical protein